MKDAPEPTPPATPFQRLIKPFLVGLAAIIPIVGTGWILVLVFKLLHRMGLSFIGWVLRVLNELRGEESASTEAWRLEDFPGDDFLWLLIPLVLIFLAGLAVMNRLGDRLLSWIDHCMMRLPAVGFIYSTLKQFMDALRNLGGEQKFKGVAYVEYPSPGCRLIGFVTGNYHDKQTGKNVTTIFIPTSPNPMTGFVIVMDDEKVFHSDMTLEEAGKMILSAGLVAPDGFANDFEKQ